MSKILKGLAALLVLAVAAAAGGLLWLRHANSPQVEGELELAVLSAPVRVLRDEIGVPYLFAANTPDLLRAQGFVTNSRPSWARSRCPAISRCACSASAATVSGMRQS